MGCCASLHQPSCARRGRVDDGVRRQCVDAVFDREDERRHDPPSRSHLTDTSMEQRVTGEQIGPDAEADRPSRVPGRVHHLDIEIVPAQHLAVTKFLLDDHILLVVRHPGQISHRLELLAVVGMERGLAIRTRLSARAHRSRGPHDHASRGCGRTATRASPAMRSSADVAVLDRRPAHRSCPGAGARSSSDQTSDRRRSRVRRGRAACRSRPNVTWGRR